MIPASRNRVADEAATPAGFADRLDRFFRENYTSLVRRHLRLGTVEDVQEAIQEVLLRLYQRFVDGEQAPPDNLEAFVNVAIRNALIDRRRRSKLISFGDLAPPNGSGGEAHGDEPPIPQIEDGEHLSQEDELAWKQLLHTIFDRLPPKWVQVAAMVMSGKTPPEIGAAFGQDGYVLRRYARELICKVLWELAGDGEPLARSFAQTFCATPTGRTKI